MARYRRKSQQRTWVVVTLILAALILIAAIVFAVTSLVRIFQEDLTSGSVSVPDLSGLTRAEAEELLRGAQLVPRMARSDYSEEVEKGKVFSQDPEPGDMVGAGRTVRYFISLGRATFTVPNLIGEPVTSAPQILGKAGLSLGNVQRVYTRLRPAGRIMNQSPKLGEEFTQPIAVDVVVADNTNLPQVTVPDLYGLPLASVEEILTREDVNLHLALVEYIAQDDVPPGTVIGQRPSAGSETELGSNVQLQVGIPSLLKAQPAKKLLLRIPVPPGPEKQLVKIKVNDALGENVVYVSEDHTPGQVIERTLDIEGEATVRVFIGDEKTPFREERI